MSLTGGALLAVTSLVALAALASTVLCWDRLAGRRMRDVVRRLLLVLGCQLTAVVVLLVWVNDNFDLYSSWTDLTGGYRSQKQVVLDVGPSTSRGSGGATHAAPTAAGTVALGVVPGVAQTVDVTGAVSGVTAPVWVWLPPQYGTPAYAKRPLPVLEAFPGYPGVPATWIHKLGLVEALRSEIEAGRMRPTVLVVPTITVAPPRDTECTDVPGGPSAETFLTTDVHAWVTSHWDVRTDAGGWSTIGYSTGAFCALKLTLRHPELYHSAASLSGYLHPSGDTTTGRLFADAASKEHSDVLWLARNQAPAGQWFFLMGSREDGTTVSDARTLAGALRAPDRARVLVLGHGGHNPAVWRSVLPAALSYLESSGLHRG